MAVFQSKKDQPTVKKSKQYEWVTTQASNTVYHFKNAKARAKAIEEIDYRDVMQLSEKEPKPFIDRRLLRNSDGVTKLVNDSIISRDLVKEVEVYRAMYEDRSRYPGPILRSINKKHGVGRPPVRPDVKVFSSRAA